MGVYLDEAATTRPRQEVVKAMMSYFSDQWYNPSSLYSSANRIKNDIENARNTIGDFINADSKEIFFTSCGSESNCWAIQGFVNYWNRKGIFPSIITSVIEHKSILNCIDNMVADTHYIPVDNNGFINIYSLDYILDHISMIDSAPMDSVLVSIQFANNEIGTIQNIKQIAKLVHKYGAVFHTDAIQAFGHIPIDVQELDIDMLSASGHKINAPKGIGFLYKKNIIKIDPLIYGSQMDGMRGGTENTAFIVGMAKAVELIQKDKEYNLRLTVLRNNFISELKALGCKVNGSLEERLPNNINVTLPQNITGESMVYMLDLDGIAIATGSACNSHSIEPSHVLKAIGLSDNDAAKTVRITLPYNITMDEIDKVISKIKTNIVLLSIED